MKNKINCGVDITNINRLEFSNIALAKRFLTEEELEVYNKIEVEKDKKKFLATYWSIKEAIFKALNAKITFKLINIEKKNNQYQVNIPKLKVSVSTSFEEPYVIAYVITY